MGVLICIVSQINLLNDREEERVCRITNKWLTIDDKNDALLSQRNIVRLFLIEHYMKLLLNISTRKETYVIFYDICSDIVENKELIRVEIVEEQTKNPRKE